MNNVPQEQPNASDFYSKNYNLCEPVFLNPGTTIILGNKKNRICRFCNKDENRTSFRNAAHAIPESFGNKSLFTYYECDNCNKLFGNGIENDFGNWSKPIRTFSHISGKKGVPTLKKEGVKLEWRVEYDKSGLHIKQYEENPFFEIDESNHRITFQLERDSFTPVAILKAFVRIGLTILPSDLIHSFLETILWVMEMDHSKRGFMEFPILRTLTPGPRPSNHISLLYLIRKNTITDVPYAFYVIQVGNETFQVLIPSLREDECIIGNNISFPYFPAPNGLDPLKYGNPKRSKLELNGRGVVRGEKISVTFGFDQIDKLLPRANLSTALLKTI